MTKPPLKHWIKETLLPGAKKPTYGVLCGAALTEQGFKDRIAKTEVEVTCKKCGDRLSSARNLRMLQ